MAMVTIIEVMAMAIIIKEMLMAMATWGTIMVSESIGVKSNGGRLFDDRPRSVMEPFKV